MSRTKKSTSKIRRLRRHKNIIKKTTKKTTKKIIKTKIKNKINNKQMGGTVSKTKTCQCIDYEFDSTKKLLIVSGVNGHKCNRPAINGTNFCEKHQNCLGFLKLYRSGSEPEYKPENWSHKNIQKSHNCYTYFLNNQIKSLQKRCDQLCPDGKKCGGKCADLKPQPGDFYLLLRDGNLKNKKRTYNCQDMEDKILRDNPSIKKSKLLEKCPKNSYKGALVIDPDHTYHFYRQDSNGMWSHKPGTLSVTNLDASDQLIYAPHIADRNYAKDNNNNDAINYTEFCRYYCVPDNKIVDLHSI